jgi:peptidoglycan/xylan/chitin deacetylase (PgdA/CDA1 family)
MVATPISATRVDLSWTDRSSTELGFKIERQTGPNGLFYQIAMVGADVVSYSDFSPAPATNYYYRVRAYDATRNSSYSNEDWALTDGKSFAEIVLGNTSRPQIALTFDAGTAAIRSGLLTTLRTNKVYCTFFPTGIVTELQPGQLQQIADDQHHIGNHTWDHPDLRFQTPELIEDEFQRCDDMIYATTGHHTRSFFRAPYGARNQYVLDTAAAAGYRHVFWTVDSGDVGDNSAQDIINRSINGAENGAVILYHCTLSNTEAAIPTVITELRSMGYELVTVPELVAPEEVTSPPGTINAGWNLISIPTEIANPTPAVVFRNQEIDTNLVRYDREASTWKFYDALNPPEFGLINPDEGYYLRVTDATTLKCMGEQPSADRHIKLKQPSQTPGQWNIIGYPFNTAQEWSNCSFFNPAAEEPKTRTYAEASAAGWIDPIMWWWESSGQSFRTTGVPDDFPSTTQAEPWYGYWLRTYVDGMEMIVPIP